MEGVIFFTHLVQTVFKLRVACAVNDVLTLHLNYAQICVSLLTFVSCFTVVLHVYIFKVILSLKKISLNCPGHPLYRIIFQLNLLAFYVEYVHF